MLVHAGIVDSRKRNFFQFNREWTKTIKTLKMLCKRIIVNTSAIGQHAAHTTDQLSSPSC